MKRIIVLLSVLAATGATSFALPIAWEPFNYPLTPTNLCGNATLDGFEWDFCGAAASMADQPFINSGTLSYPGLATSSGNSVQFGGVAGLGMGARFCASSGSALASYSAGGNKTIYASFIMQVTDTNGLSTAGVFNAGFNNTAGAQGSLPTVVGTRLVEKLSGDGFVIGTAKNGANASDFIWDSTIRHVGDPPIFVVLEYQIVDSAGGGGGDIQQMWINPDSSTFNRNDMVPTPTLVAPAIASGLGDVTGSGIYSFIIWCRNAGQFKAMIIDQVTLGSTWADITLTNIPVALTSQPRNARAIAGGSATFSVNTFNAATFQWQHNGVDITGATQKSLTLTNVQLADAGSYHVTIGNPPATPVTSSDATLSVFPDVYAHLSPLWSIPPESSWGGVGPGNRPYLLVDPGSAPGARSFAYNSLSNTIMIACHTNSSTLASTGMVYVLDAATGNDLYQMNTAGITTGVATTNGALSLNVIDVAEDGAVYGANVSDVSDTFTVYRWDNSGPSAAPAVVFTGDPSGAGNTRWGDSMAIRGAGTGTQLLFDNSTGVWGAVVTNSDSGWQYGVFTNVIGGSCGGRFLKFDAGNTFWEKHSGPLNLASYNTVAYSSTLLTNFTFTAPLASSDFNTNMQMLAGLSFAADSSAPDTLALYDMTDPSQPLLVGNYPFLVNHNGNNNGCGRVIWAGERVFAMDANNGIMALTVVPHLSITPSLPNVVLAWSTNFTGYTLQATPSLSPLVAYTNVSTGTIVGSQYSVTTPASSSALFYRLKK